MYVTKTYNETHEYDINERDAYIIAMQVLKEMRDEAEANPDLFKNHGFSDIYDTLIRNVIGTTDRIYKTLGWSEED